MNDCILRTTCLTGKGYSQVTRNGKRYYYHRLAYEEAKGKIPEGLVIDHLCMKPNCINPDHLEAVTNAENLRRAAKWGGNKTHCNYGHEFTPENTYIENVKGKHWTKRSCRTCQLTRVSKRYCDKKNSSINN